VTDQLTSPTEWHTEFPVQWTPVQPDAAPEPDAVAAPMLLIPTQRTSPAISRPTVITLPDVATSPPPTSPPPPPARRTPPGSFLDTASPRRRRTVIAAEALLSLAVAGAGIGIVATAGGSSTVTLRGTVTISLANHAGATPNFVTGRNGTCSGWGKYADLAPGAAVTFVDSTGTPTATGVLGMGRIDGQSGCQLTWQVPNVAKQQLYRVVIGRRAMQIFTRPLIATGFNTAVG